jgi:hypothetical protein
MAAAASHDPLPAGEYTAAAPQFLPVVRLRSSIRA